MKVSIVVPIYNEGDNIPPLYNEINEALAVLPHSFEIIFINDGSTDGSEDLLNELASKDDKCKVIHFRRNFGQTAAIMAGIEYANGDIIVSIDGDLQNDPKDIPKLIEEIDKGYDVCSGWRKVRKDNPLLRKIPSLIANKLISRISGVNLHDYGCTLKAYKKDIIKGVRLYGEMHRFIPIYTSWRGARVNEIPVNHRPRLYGKSKYGLSRIFKIILDLIVVKFMATYINKPIYIFGGFGLVSLLLSMACFALMVYYKYWGGKSYIETPLPQVFVLLVLIGLQSILIGILAELLMRTYYESQKKDIYLIKDCHNIAQNKKCVE